MNTQTDQYQVTAEELQQFIEQWESLEVERQKTGSLQKELMQECKNRGYDTKIVRQIIRLRKRSADEVAEEQAILELYKEALGME